MTDGQETDYEADAGWSDDAAWDAAVRELEDAYLGRAEEDFGVLVDRLEAAAMERGLATRPVEDAGVLVTPLGIELISLLMGATPPGVRKDVLDGLKAAELDATIRLRISRYMTDQIDVLAASLDASPEGGS